MQQVIFDRENHISALKEMMYRNRNRWGRVPATDLLDILKSVCSCGFEQFAALGSTVNTLKDLKTQLPNVLRARQDDGVDQDEVDRYCEEYFWGRDHLVEVR